GGTNQAPTRYLARGLREGNVHVDEAVGLRNIEIGITAVDRVSIAHRRMPTAGWPRSVSSHVLSKKSDASLPRQLRRVGIPRRPHVAVEAVPGAGVEVRLDAGMAADGVPGLLGRGRGVELAE